MLREEFEIFECAPELIDPVLPFVYFDNAATMQRPKKVIEAESEYYGTLNSNPLRGLYKISEQSTKKLEEARKRVAKYIGAEPDEIIFTKNTTEGINLVANGIKKMINSKDKILIDLDSHHSNILPFTERYSKQSVISDNLLKTCSEEKQVKMIALTGLSNISGRDGTEKISLLRDRGYKGYILLDAAQLIAHKKIDLRKLDVDFMAFSGHKIGAPMGIGVLYVRRNVMSELQPLNYGGEMVEEVNIDGQKIVTQFAFGPQKFEGGTLNMGGIVGLKETLDFWEKYNKNNSLFEQEEKLTKKVIEGMQKIPKIKIYYGENGIVLFNVCNVHPHDTAQILSNYGIMVRAGWHCAEPFLTEQKIGSAVRISLSFYNTQEEVNYFLSVIKKIRSEMGLT